MVLKIALTYLFIVSLMMETPCMTIYYYSFNVWPKVKK